MDCNVHWLNWPGQGLVWPLFGVVMSWADWTLSGLAIGMADLTFIWAGHCLVWP